MLHSPPSRSIPPPPDAPPPPPPSSSAGPWMDWRGIVTPPWPPRASAAITTAWETTSAWLASGAAARVSNWRPCGSDPVLPHRAGLTFVAGEPRLPTFSDAYLIDPGVCLLAPSNGKVRRMRGWGCPSRGHATPPRSLGSRSPVETPVLLGAPTLPPPLLSGVRWPDRRLAQPRRSRLRVRRRVSRQEKTCRDCAVMCSDPPPPPLCAGDALCGSCTPTVAYGFPDCRLCPSDEGTPCGGGASPPRGFCDETIGCVCISPFERDAVAGSCASCAQGFWGATCAACPSCGLRGSCNGSGTGGGSGQCDCSTGWTGAACGDCAQGFWGAACAACPSCGPHGTCDGSGTTGGSGQCTCAGGWQGPLCTEAVPLPVGLSAGAIAATIVLTAACAAALGVFVYARFLGGGPAVEAAWAAAKAGVRRGGAALGWGAASRLERASLIQQRPTSRATAVARFAPIGDAA